MFPAPRPACGALNIDVDGERLDLEGGGAEAKARPLLGERLDKRSV